MGVRITEKMLFKSAELGCSVSPEDRAMGEMSATLDLVIFVTSFSRWKYLTGNPPHHLQHHYPPDSLQHRGVQLNSACANSTSSLV